MALDNQQDKTALPGLPVETLFNKEFTLCVNGGMVSGHTQAVNSAPIKANASMESVVLKVPGTSIDNHLKKVEEENEELQKKNDPTQPPASITAPEHQLRRVKKHHQNLLDNPVGGLEQHTKKHSYLAIKHIIIHMIQTPAYP